MTNSFQLQQQTQRQSMFQKDTLIQYNKQLTEKIQKKQSVRLNEDEQKKYYIENSQKYVRLQMQGYNNQLTKYFYQNSHRDRYEKLMKFINFPNNTGNRFIIKPNKYGLGFKTSSYDEKILGLRITKTTFKKLVQGANQIINEIYSQEKLEEESIYSSTLKNFNNLSQILFVIVLFLIILNFHDIVGNIYIQVIIIIDKFNFYHQKKEIFSQIKLGNQIVKYALGITVIGYIIIMIISCYINEKPPQFKTFETSVLQSLYQYIRLQNLTLEKQGLMLLIGPKFYWLELKNLHQNIPFEIDHF